MRQTYLGGEKLFVDYAGDTVPVIVDPASGRTRQAHIFVAVMGASSLSFAYASWSEKLVDWVEGHVQAFDYFGGAPKLIVPDNPKVAVIKACFYDPQVNRTYAELAEHYDTAILPARPRKPRDKAKVEACVRIVERWLLGRLRHRRFYSLAEVNAAIAELLVRLNDQRVLRYVRRTRRQLFQEMDQPRLKALPAEVYVLAEWRVRKVGLDYHVEVEGHFYSVPYRHARTQVEVRLTARTVEVFAASERIAAHMRGSGDAKHTTLPDHMPSSHRRYSDWTLERIRREARAIGPSVEMLCELILEERPHPEQGFRSCMGVVRRALPLRVGPGRRRLPAGPGDRGQELRLGQIHPRQPPGRPARAAASPRPRRRRPGPPVRARQRPRLSLLPLRRTTVLSHPTLDQMNALGLHGMAKAFAELDGDDQTAGLRHAEWLALLLDREAVHRHDKRLATRLSAAKLRHQAAPEDIDYRAPRGLDRRMMEELLKGDWIRAHENLAIIGPTGAGKSWLACALGHKACRDNHSVLYVRAPKLFDDLAMAHADGSAGRRLKALGAVQLLILDDWGLSPLDDQGRHDLLEILEDRYGRRSTLVTSQLPVADWHAAVGQTTYADAILDRLVHNAHRIELSGDSLRRTRRSAKA